MRRVGVVELTFEAVANRCHDMMVRSGFVTEEVYVGFDERTLIFIGTHRQFKPVVPEEGIPHYIPHSFSRTGPMMFREDTDWENWDITQDEHRRKRNRCLHGHMGQDPWWEGKEI